MREGAIAIGIIAFIVAIAAAANIPYSTSFQIGLVLLGVGFAFGLPTAFIYHVILYKGLKAMGDVPRGWIWRPISLNDSVENYYYKRMMPWLFAGAAGFVLVALGLTVLATAVAAGLLR